MADIVNRLRDAATGQPYAKIPWPHRVLIDAAHEIEQLRMALLAITPFAEWQLSEMTAERNPGPLKNAVKMARAALDAFSAPKSGWAPTDGQKQLDAARYSGNIAHAPLPPAPGKEEA